MGLFTYYDLQAVNFTTIAQEATNKYDLLSHSKNMTVIHEYLT